MCMLGWVSIVCFECIAERECICVLTRKCVCVCVSGPLSSMGFGGQYPVSQRLPYLPGHSVQTWPLCCGCPCLPWCCPLNHTVKGSMRSCLNKTSPVSQTEVEGIFKFYLTFILTGSQCWDKGLFSRWALYSTTRYIKLHIHIHSKIFVFFRETH